ncbi:hypothetical protein BTHI11S_03112 [Bosea thiooxidans]
MPRTRSSSSARACWTMVSRVRSASSSSCTAGGTMSAMMRAPWLPPKTRIWILPSPGSSYSLPAASTTAWAHRVAYMAAFGLLGRRQAADLGEAGRDHVGAAGEEAVGPADHGVLLVDQRAHAGERGAEYGGTVG